MRQKKEPKKEESGDSPSKMDGQARKKAFDPIDEKARKGPEMPELSQAAKRLIEQSKEADEMTPEEIDAGLRKLLKLNGKNGQN
ncbi:MAG: hypothetical protein ABIH29_02650 [Candidatus Micrarchaeota archaeon]